jgi:hypothetical protein
MFKLVMWQFVVPEQVLLKITNVKNQFLKALALGCNGKLFLARRNKELVPPFIYVVQEQRVVRLFSGVRPQLALTRVIL